MALTKKLSEMTDRELRDINNKALEESRAFYEDVRAGKTEAITKDREAQVDKWLAESDLVEKEFEFRRKEEKAKPKIKVGGIDDTAESQYDPAFNPTNRAINRARKKFSRGYKNLNAEEKKIYNLVEHEERAFEDAMAVGLDPDRMGEETRTIFKNMEKRAQTTQTTTTGGYFIPQGFINEVIMYLKYISPFFEEFNPSPTAEAQSLFDFRRTNSGNDLPWPSNDDTANAGALLAENTTIGAAVDFTISRIVLKAYKYSSNPILVPYELFEDSGIDIASFVGELIGSRIGRAVNPHLTTGDNSSKPQGIVTGATSGKVTASTSATTFQEVIDLIHSVDPSYRKRPTCRFMFHDGILQYLKKLTVGAATTNARPLWQPSWDQTAPPTIDGFQYVINQDMQATVSTGTKIMLFGDMKQYVIRMVNDVRAYRLEERYRDLDQTGFVTFIRMDGRTKNTAAIKYLRVS